MIIQCESCSRKFIVKNENIPKEGRMVQCGYCSSSWHQMPSVQKTESPTKKIVSKTKINSDVNIDNIVDGTIIGGIKLKVGNTLIDGSVSTKLDRLKQSMVNK